MALAPDHQAKLVDTLADKAVVSQERLGDLLGGYPVHVNLQVQLLHLLGGEERGDLAEQVRELLVLLEHLLTHGERSVEGGEELLVVLEEHQVQVGDAPVCRENRAEVAPVAVCDLVVYESVLDTLDVRELVPVGLLQARQPVVAHRELTAHTDRSLVRVLLYKRSEIRERREAILVGCLAVRGYGVAVLLRRGLEPVNVVLFKVAVAYGLVGRLGDAARLAEDVDPTRTQVLPVHVDLARLHRRPDGIGTGKPDLVVDRRPALLQREPGYVSEHELLGKLFGADGVRLAGEIVVLGYAAPAATATATAATHGDHRHHDDDTQQPQQVRGFVRQEISSF